MARSDILRIYDKAILEWVKGRVKLAGHALTYHIATPDRPYAFEIPLDDANGTIDTQRAVNMLMTPHVTITRTGLAFDQTRNNTSIYRNVRFWDEELLEVVQSARPKPWNLTYQVDIVARLRNDIQGAIQWFLYNPEPLCLLNIDFKYPFGKKNITLRIEGVRDNSVLETGESLRFYRYTVPCLLEAYMFEAFDDPADLLTTDSTTTKLVRTVLKVRTNMELVKEFPK